MKTNADICAELGVDILVEMDEWKILPKDSRIGTYGLGGCTCIVAENEFSVLFCHFSPLSLPLGVNLVRCFNPQNLTVFCPGVHKENSFELTPEQHILKDLSPCYVPYNQTHLFCGSILSRSVIWKDSAIHHCFGSSQSFSWASEDSLAPEYVLPNPVFDGDELFAQIPPEIVLELKKLSKTKVEWPYPTGSHLLSQRTPCTAPQQSIGYSVAD